MEFELLGTKMIGMLKLMKQSLPMISVIKMKTKNNKVVLGQYYKRKKK